MSFSLISNYSGMHMLPKSHCRTPTGLPTPWRPRIFPPGFRPAAAARHLTLFPARTAFPCLSECPLPGPPETPPLLRRRSPHPDFSLRMRFLPESLRPGPPYLLPEMHSLYIQTPHREGSSRFLPEVPPCQRESAGGSSEGSTAHISLWRKADSATFSESPAPAGPAARR